MRSGQQIDVIVIGGGAAGFFAAINMAERNKNLNVHILEKSNKLLSKVRVSGGGRCNVTNACFDNNELVKNYPRGQKELRQVFSRFAVHDTIDWFQNHNVPLKTEEDLRMFPKSDNSKTIIDCFLQAADHLNIKISTGCEVFSIQPNKNRFNLKTNLGNFEAQKVVCASGGHHKAGGYQYLSNLGHTIVSPIPSLFTFNLPGEAIRKLLQGLSVELAEVKIQNSKLSYAGPVLITHWGISGPAVLKLSAFAAGDFFENAYSANIIVNWLYPDTLEEVEQKLSALQIEKKKALPWSNPLPGIPKRLWEFLCNSAGIINDRTWAELGKKQIKELAKQVQSSNFIMQGKTTFKEEFVTCGGVHLKEVDFRNMESRLVKGLYFCGEVLNIDGITGGFNFQSAWSTAFICATAITE